MIRRRAATITALAAAVVVLVGSVAYAATTVRSSAHPGPRSMQAGSMMGGSMMGDSVMGGSMMGSAWLVGDGTPVTSIAAARARASQAASASGLHPGEVIWFDNGFYVELKDATGSAATEVIVDPADGTVTTEPGPAMMWNTRYGMHGQTTVRGTTAVSQQQASAIATAWLAANQPGATVLSVDAYPGYFTVDIGQEGTITGMLSVNASGGQVWFHTWHGTFIARQDA